MNLFALVLLALPTGALTPDDCVRIALERSARIAEADAKVAGIKATLASVQAQYGVRLQATAWLAPMFTVNGDALRPVERRYGWRDWGPYAHLEAVLAKPIYTFGRVEAGERAAHARLRVERARVDAARAAVATEVRRLYHLHVFTRSMLPSLKLGARMVDEALAKAEALHAAGEGVTQADLGRLQFGRINGGVAIGLQWDYQPARSQAAVDAARAREAEVQSLKAFAATGIPLEVYRAHQSLVQQAELAKLTKQSVKTPAAG